jgi:hypothetical protein
MLGSVSPLQMIRGMLDISAQRWKESPLLASARAALAAAAVYGIVEAALNPRRGVVIVALAVLGYLSLRRQ